MLREQMQEYWKQTKEKRLGLGEKCSRLYYLKVKA